MKKKLSVAITATAVLVALTVTIISFAQDGFTRIIATRLTEENAAVTISSDAYDYAGKALKPTVRLVYTDKEKNRYVLIKNKDYNVQYEGNDAPGVATIRVVGINAYAGTLTKTFKIMPQKAACPEPVQIKRTVLGIKWTPQQAVDGYEISIKRASKQKYKLFFVKGDKSTFSFKQLAENTPYKIKLRSFIVLDGKKQFSKYSEVLEVQTASLVDTPDVSGYCSLSSAPTLTWNRVKHADVYIVYRSRKKNGTYARIGVTDTTAFSDDTARMHKTYYYKVKARRIIKGKRHYSHLSAAVKIKALKTVLVGDSVMESVKVYKALPRATYCVKIGMGTYTFYSSYYFKVKGKTATGCEKVISYEPDRVFIMFGMNEAHYKDNAGILKYYRYAIDDIKAARPQCEIVLLPVSPTRPTKDKNIPQKGRIKSFNNDLKRFAGKNKCAYYDFTPQFKDKKGELKKEFDDGDGCHWNPKACRFFAGLLEEYTVNQTKQE